MLQMFVGIKDKDYDKNYTIAIAVHFITIRKVGENDAAKLPDRQMNNHIDDLCSILDCTIFHYPMDLTHTLFSFLYTEWDLYTKDK